MRGRRGGWWEDVGVGTAASESQWPPAGRCPLRPAERSPGGLLVSISRFWRGGIMLLVLVAYSMHKKELFLIFSFQWKVSSGLGCLKLCISVLAWETSSSTSDIWHSVQCLGRLGRNSTWRLRDLRVDEIVMLVHIDPGPGGPRHHI